MLFLFMSGFGPGGSPTHKSRLLRPMPMAIRLLGHENNVIATAGLAPARISPRRLELRVSAIPPRGVIYY